jgi:SAM-dependent methyltransferase
MKPLRSFEYISKYYDLIYEDKDYEKEVSFIEDIFAKYHKPKKILEIGCGTGNYTKILAERGYKITGVDISENMLNVARQKCECSFAKGDMRNFSLHEKFDTCIAMFAVIGYVTDNEDVIKALKNIRSHLEPNSLLVFDVWNGLSVMRNLPEVRVKKIEKRNMKIVRIAVPNLRAFDHICEVNYTLFAMNKVTNEYTEFDEKHIMRFYFPQEIRFFLKEAGFEVLEICPFMDLNGQVDESVWNITVVARAVTQK